MGKIIKGLRTASEIADDLKKRGWRLEVSDDRTEFKLVPPDDATEAEIEAAAAFFLELMQQAAAQAGAEGKITIRKGQGDA